MLVKACCKLAHHAILLPFCNMHGPHCISVRSGGGHVPSMCTVCKRAGTQASGARTYLLATTHLLLEVWRI